MFIFSYFYGKRFGVNFRFYKFKGLKFDAVKKTEATKYSKAMNFSKRNLR